MSHRIPALIWSVYAIEVAFAAGTTISGLFLPNLMVDFGLSVQQAGLLGSLQALGAMLMIFLAGWLSDRVGPGYILASGCALLALAPLLLASAPVTALVVVSIVLLGIALGLIDPMTNVLLVAAGGSNAGRWLSYLHASFGIGAFSFPIMASVGLAYGVPWRIQLLILAVMAFAGVAWFSFLRRQWPKAAAAAKVGKTAEGFPKGQANLVADQGGPWMHPVVLVLAGAMLLYAGAYRNLSLWTVLFFQSELGATQVAGARALSLLFLVITLSRLANAAIVDRLPKDRLLALYATGGALGLLPFAFAASPHGALLALALFGACTAGIFPLVTAFLLSRFPQNQGAMAGLIYGSSSFGGMLMPSLLGTIAKTVGLRAGLMVNAGAMFVAAAGFWYVHRRSLEREPVPPISSRQAS